MSKYHRLESGAVPGARDPVRGPKGIYSFSMQGGISRALNHTEADADLRTIDESLDAAMETARENHAKRYQRRLRQIMKPFDLSRPKAGLGPWLPAEARRAVEARGAKLNRESKPAPRALSL